jgi:hypothetical protein
MINEHIILVETSYHLFNATCDFNTKACSLKKLSMNWNIQDN